MATCILGFSKVVEIRKDIWIRGRGGKGRQSCIIREIRRIRGKREDWTEGGNWREEKGGFTRQMSLVCSA